MTSRLLPALALTALMGLSACGGQASVPTAETPRPDSAPAATSIAPPQPGMPSPDAATAPPPGSVTEADLPAADDLQWTETTRWRTGDTTAGGGDDQVSACQQTRLESLGGNAIVVRTFALGDDAGQGASVAMSFDSRELADQAYDIAQGWLGDCEAVLTAQNRTGGRQTVSATPVPLQEGRAVVTEWAYSTAPDSGEFESQGLIQLEDRLNLTVMRVEGLDNNWDLALDGPVGAVHPMLRSVPAIAATLAR